jgi:chitodextrinase
MVAVALAGCLAGSGASAAADDVTLEGKLVAVHSDDFAHGRSDVRYSLETGQATYAVEFAEQQPELPQANRVVVHGALNGNALAVGKGGISAAPGSTVVAATTGAKKVLVVLVKFADNRDRAGLPVDCQRPCIYEFEFRRRLLRHRFVGPADAVGRRDPVGHDPVDERGDDVRLQHLGLTGGHGRGKRRLQPEQLQLCPVRAQLGPGLRLGRTRVPAGDAVVDPRQLRGPARLRARARTQLRYPSLELVFVHAERDIMGQASTYEHTNFSRGNFGWLSASNTQDVTSSATYSIHSIEPSDPTGVQALRIKRDSSTYLLLEFRQPDGVNFDNFSPSSPQAAGVTVRVVPAYSTMSQSQLVDTTPATSGYSDAPLAVGQSVYDPVSNVTIQTTAAGSSGASVLVTFAPDTTPPSAPSSLSASATDSTHIKLTWGASTDNVGVTGYRIYRVGTGLVGTATTTTYTDSGLTTNTSYSYYVTAVDGATNESSQSNTASATTPILDTQAPSTPTNLVATKASKPTRVSLTWTASTDNVGVAGYRVYRNCALLATTSAASHKDTKPPKGTDAYTVVAFDAAGNASLPSNQASVTV